MTPRTWAYADVEEDDLAGRDLPARDRIYESYGRQGVGMATYAPEPHASRGAARVDLGEPVAARPPQGPKNWQRRDDRIHDDVCARLSDDGLVDASDLEVVVHQGEVVITGTVADREQRDRALAVADGVRGVVDVVNRIHVSRAPRQGDR